MASLNDRRQTAGEFSVLRTEEVSTQEVFTHRGTVRLHGLSDCSSCRLGSVSTNQTSPWPTSVFCRTKKETKTIKNTGRELCGNPNDLERGQLKET